MRAIRGNIVNRLQNLSDEQLQQIPAGFNANIHWQLGHLVVTPALLTFKLSGLEMPLPPEMVAAFAKGSAPSEASAAFHEKVLEAGLYSILDDIESAFSAERFSAFDAYKTSAGITLKAPNTPSPTPACTTAFTLVTRSPSPEYSNNFNYSKGSSINSGPSCMRASRLRFCGQKRRNSKLF